MPRPTRILQMRDRRDKRRRAGGGFSQRLLGTMILIVLLGAVLLLALSSIGTMIAYASLTQEMPEFDQLVAEWEQASSSFETSRIYAWRDKEQVDPVQIYEIADPLGGERKWVKLEELPQPLIDAIIAFEDPSFWRDQNLSNADLIRLIFDISQASEIVGGRYSLLRTVVRNNVMGRAMEASTGAASLDAFRNRVKELLLTHRVSNSYTGAQILEWHLNTAYFGNLAFGVEAAARVYFDKSAGELSLGEAAMLAAIPQAPELNPIDRPEDAKQRQEQVLVSMAEVGAINRDILAAAQFSTIEATTVLGERFDIIAPHFALLVRRELEKRFGPELLLRGGLRVYTSLDLGMQHQAECVSRAHINRLSGHIGTDLPADERDSCIALAHLQPMSSADLGVDRDVNNAAVIVLDAETAQIRAMVGSLNYWDERIDGSSNFAIVNQHQPGTAIRPFTYLTALSQGYTAATMVLDVEKDFGDRNSGGPFIPNNEDQQYHGPMSLREALGNGYHVPSVEVMSWVGVDRVVRTSRSLGITGLDEPSHQYGLSLALGGGNVSVIDMAYAYNVINNMGVMLGHSQAKETSDSNGRTLDPVAILRVEDSDGDLLYEHNQQQRREILSPQLAYLMNDMLSDRSARCEAFGCPNVMELPDNRPAAVVTGSTNDARDAWTIGYTPQLTAAVWVGNSDDSPTDNLTGIEAAAPIWQALTSWAMQDERVAVWTQPPDLVELAVCSISGLLSTPYCPSVSELFIVGTQPTVYDNIYREFAINRETGRLATIYTPPDLVERRIFQIYPGQAQEWAQENGIPQPPSEYDTIRSPINPSGDSLITQPRPFSFASGTVPIVGTASGDDFEQYRLAYFAGLTPTNLQAIVDGVREAKEDELLGEWDVSDREGLYTVLLTVLKGDGSFVETALPLTIDNTAPTIRVLSPVPGQLFTRGENKVEITTEVEDNFEIGEVRFLLDEAELPFATSKASPFTADWTIRSVGCHRLTAIAVDAAGNEKRSATIPFCVVDDSP